MILCYRLLDCWAADEKVPGVAWIIAPAPADLFAQKNGFDCGPLTCWFAKSLLLGEVRARMCNAVAKDCCSSISILHFLAR